jgi:hypothetical protein
VIGSERKRGMEESIFSLSLSLSLSLALALSLSLSLSLYFSRSLSLSCSQATVAHDDADKNDSGRVAILASFTVHWLVDLAADGV